MVQIIDSVPPLPRGGGGNPKIHYCLKCCSIIIRSSLISMSGVGQNQINPDLNETILFRSVKTRKQSRGGNTFCNLVELSPRPTRVSATRASPGPSPPSPATAAAASGRGSEAPGQIFSLDSETGPGDTSGYRPPRRVTTGSPPWPGELTHDVCDNDNEYYLRMLPLLLTLLVSRAAAEKQSSQPLSGMEQSWSRATLGRWPEGKTGCK